MEPSREVTGINSGAITTPRDSRVGAQLGASECEPISGRDFPCSCGALGAPSTVDADDGVTPLVSAALWNRVQRSVGALRGAGAMTPLPNARANSSRSAAPPTRGSAHTSIRGGVRAEL